MTRSAHVTAAPYALAAIALISCSMLMYEILLTRICALRLYFHFGYLVVSNCLLGIGASGTMIFIYQKRWRPHARRWILAFCLLYLVSLVLTYAFLLEFTIPVRLDLADLEHLGRFSVYTLASAVPFFFGGAVVGLILTFNAHDVNRVYSLDLLGAGAGCLLMPFLLARSGAGGAMVFISLLALASLVVAAPPRRRGALLAAGAALGCVGFWLLPTLDQRFPVPGKGQLDLTRDAVLHLGHKSEYSRWSTNSRIDLFPLTARQRFLFARGGRHLRDPLPEQKLIMQDGWAGTFITNFAENPEKLAIVEGSMYSAALQLKQRPRVLIIGAGGGVDVWAALLRNPLSVRAIELNRQILDIHRHELPHYSRPLLDDPRIEFVHGEGRSELMRDSDRYDVIQMSGIDTWTALSSGAYVLAENYLYTREAIEAMYRHLDPEGVLQIIRFAAEMETLRLLSNIHAALRSLGVQDFERSVIVLRTRDGLAAVLVKRGIFSPVELDGMARFATRAMIERVYVPAETRDGVIPDFVLTADKGAMIERFPRDISPTSDDRPYFFNFSKWKNPFSSARYLPEPTNVSQGNPAFLLGQLVSSIVLSAALILLPLVLLHREAMDRAYFRTFLVYFMGLGIGFITIEISLMQKLTLFLGHPLYSITVTLFSILVFTGLGSLLSEPLFHAGRLRIWPVPLVLVVLLGSFLWVSPPLFRAFIGEPIAGRVAIAVGLLAPIGLVLGVPFAYGIRLVNRFNPTIVPWAWAVNACCTVIGSVATVILSMNFGFRFVMVAAVVIYSAAFLTLRRLPA